MAIVLLRLVIHNRPLSYLSDTVRNTTIGFAEGKMSIYKLTTGRLDYTKENPDQCGNEREKENKSN